jgi:ATP-dependent helicase HrpB
VMSASLAAEPVSRFLGGCPVVEVRGRPHPIDVRDEPGLSLGEAVRTVVARPGGHLLCFLPGAGEIRRAMAELAGALSGVRVLPLHGTLSAEEQDQAIAPSAVRKVVLATNVAETSLTVEGVTDVIDTGQHKLLRYAAESGLDRLQLERIPADSAEQRAGRAGRTGPGRVLRLWDPRDRLRASREPEIARVDLSAPALEVFAWGSDPTAFDWFECPSAERLESALRQLERLGAVEGRRLTPLGQAIHALPAHPRLARVLLAAGGGARAAAVCAVLAEGWRPPASGAAATTDSDPLSAADRIREAPEGVRAAARELEVIGRELLRGNAGARPDDRLLPALLAGFPDRVARRREPRSPRLVLASGQGALLARESGVREGELLVALEVAGGAAGAGSEALVRSASRIELAWLAGVTTALVHRLDERSGSVRAFAQDRYDSLLLAERPVPPDPAQAAPLLREALERRGLGLGADLLRRRLRLAGLEADLLALAMRACEGLTSLPDLEVPEQWLPADTRTRLDRLAPMRLPLPSGRTAALDYREDGSIVAAVKLQELFGLAETPRLGPARQPVTFELLAPNGRPVQTTRDLRSFWERTYPEVRRELRGRYPKHPWPEDPWSAAPTHRTKRRG